MIPYRIVPDGLSAFGVELTMPGQFRSVRGFASVAEAHAWVIEQDKAEARRIASVAGRVQPASQLIRRNHALRRQAERVWHHTERLCSPLLMSRVLPGMDEVTTDELIERNHRLLARAAAVCAHAQQGQSDRRNALGAGPAGADAAASGAGAAPHGRRRGDIAMGQH